jgi:hypothetical protein
MMGTSLGEGTEVEPIGMTTESHSYDMPEALKVDFLSSLIKMKKLIQKKWPTPLDSHEAKSLERAIDVEEYDPLMIMLLSGMPSLYAPTKAVPLSDPDRETERYLE